MPGVLRVVTLNLWARLGPWEARRVEAAAWLDVLGPDIVLLQEVIADPDGGTSAEEVTALAATRYHVAFAGGRAPGWCQEGPGCRFGVAVLSRWPLSAEAVELPDTDGNGTRAKPNLLLHARTAGLDVFSAHLAAPPSATLVRQRQVVAVDAAARSRADPAGPLPPVVGGDFNAEPDSDEVRYLSGLCAIDGCTTYWVDAMRSAGPPPPAFTLHAANPHLTELNVPNRRVDHLFVGDAFMRPGGAGRVTAAGLACHESLTGTLASDHYGVWCDVAWPSRDRQDGPAAPS